MKFTALCSSEIRRLLARRVVRYGLLGLLMLAVLVVVVATVRSAGSGPLDNTMRLSSLWMAGRDGPTESVILAMSVYAFLLVVGIAATAVGGDYRAGTFGTVLTWEPRRDRVFAARMLAVAVVAVAVYLVFAAVFVGGWWLGAALRGSTSGLGRDFWPNLIATVARCALVAALLAEITGALVFLTRSTVGAVIVWFAYLVGIEGILAGRVQELRPSLLIENLGAFLQDSVLRIRTGDFGDVVYLVRPGSGLIRTATIAIVVAALGLGAFHRRDVL